MKKMVNDYLMLIARSLDHYKFIRLGEDDNDNYEDFRGDYIDSTVMERRIACDGDEFDCKVNCE